MSHPLIDGIRRIFDGRSHKAEIAVGTVAAGYAIRKHVTFGEQKLQRVFPSGDRFPALIHAPRSFLPPFVQMLPKTNSLQEPIDFLSEAFTASQREITLADVSL